MDKCFSKLAGEQPSTSSKKEEVVGISMVAFNIFRNHYIRPSGQMPLNTTNLGRSMIVATNADIPPTT